MNLQPLSTEVSSSAISELLRRSRAKDSLLDYAKAIDVPGRPISEDPDEWVFEKVETGLADHHKLMLKVIEDVMVGKIPRAMFFMPPGSAKSTYGSVVAPTWAMGKFPGIKIILSSYGSDLARKHGRRARQIARSFEYQDIFETKISIETSAADEWALTNQSEYMACGILSGITGNRANGLIIDDPIKGRQEADSETIRERTWAVYQEDLRTRLVPGGWEIIIQTRWHESDLAGRILPEGYNGESGMLMCRDGREWYVLCLPAQCDRKDDPLGRQIGEYLWPEWFTGNHFEAFKKVSRTWNALFQQRPQPEEGTYFQEAWFHRYTPEQKPKRIHIYGSSDYAVSEDEGDFTELGVLGLDEIGDIWVLDWWHDQEQADKWIDAQLDLIKIHKPFAFFGAKGVIKKALDPYIKKRMKERKIYCRLEWIAEVVSKVIKARAFQAMASQGKVHIPIGPMGDRIVDQLVRFPTGSHDDAVDVLALFGLALDMAHPAIVEWKPEIIKKTMAEARIDHIEKQPQAEDVYIEKELARSDGVPQDGPQYFFDVK